jgi:hypothetical protein
MSSDERGGLKAAFSNFRKSDTDRDAELKLLGRHVEQEMSTSSVPPPPAAEISGSYPVATTPPTGLILRPLLEREPVRQLSFRCPFSIAVQLKRKAAFNQLEQQEIILEGIKRVLSDIPDPPPGWDV